MPLVIVRAVQTCPSNPSQWDAWDDSGQFWYLRYRFARGTAERQPSPDVDGWTRKDPEIEFETDYGQYDGEMYLEEFAERAGIELRLGTVTSA